FSVRSQVAAYPQEFPPTLSRNSNPDFPTIIIEKHKLVLVVSDSTQNQTTISHSLGVVGVAVITGAADTQEVVQASSEVKFQGAKSLGPAKTTFAWGLSKEYSYQGRNVTNPQEAKI
ncbi:hypothetical protein BVRB_018420, partial [Beta vulgaris subsp. vulgaris]